MAILFPAIDLLNGKAVRLTKGEKKSAKEYGNALDFAKYFEDCGAKWLHIVDLDGAFEGSPKNLSVIENIATETNLQIQVGGGIRTEDTITNYLNAGVCRTILGSIALQNLNWTILMAEKYPIALSIDSKDGNIATHGWVNVSEIKAIDFAAKLKGSSVQAIVCTDIQQDGMLSGINFALTEEIAEISGIFTIASGGFSGQKDLDMLHNYPKVGGVIIGKAFYEGKLDFKNVKF
ncbi:1-(5-phosphoribosyl)-5-[(5-phosphoribosylamino)methylideneamino]imidazole-4-carboxamide isomerase [Helicobacter bilis]|uniref:1-(5-phosphoribosyl)-5-[(5- phosphoribosylamino)methylideneamino]imidazole-4- carboxamide isomerase n=1 Tax=Helicobacter bilis TaxID=37372 RepID=UPI00248D5D51|nr:1-(5-phosphoribosyl)-5-[(5-phosphoribosylamino)methylideneamino]imidazole-4-carboxamide isomerase [Helicobacter bilis]